MHDETASPADATEAAAYTAAAEDQPLAYALEPADD